MNLKSLQDLKIGDKLTRNSDKQVYKILNITSDENGHISKGSIYHFSGFIVPKKIMSKLFKVQNENFILGE